MTQRPALWLGLLALATAILGIQALVTGAVEIPSNWGLRGHLERDAQPGAYWLLTLAYLAGGATSGTLAWRRRGELVEAPPPRPGPPWARALAWLGVATGAALIAVAVWLHFNMDPIMSLMFVMVTGAGGAMLLLMGAGYLVTGRLQ